MPVRKIPGNYKFPTGEVSKGDGTAAGFEGTLERDNLILTRFDKSVLSYDEQPIKIEYQDENGLNRTYTPDLFITYVPEKRAKPRLVEVKPRELLKKNMATYAPKFRAAVATCRANGWKFEVRHEGHIRTVRLEVLKQLRPYMSRKADDLKAMRLINHLRKNGPCTIAQLLEHFCPMLIDRLNWLPVIWICIAHQNVAADLSALISPKTILSAK